MAKSKYTPEVVQQILDVVAQTGSDRASWEAAGISETTFYDWCNKYPEFSEQIKEAKAQFRESCPEVLITQAHKALADYLFGRVEITTTVITRGINEEGSYSEETTKRVKLSPPRWAIERVLGKPIDILEAVKVLVDAKVLPRWMVQVVADEISGARRGVTEAFTGILPGNDIGRVKPGLSEDTAAAIRSHILGIDSAPSATLSASLDSRQFQGESSREVTSDRS